jgi:hypothetical protein
MLNTPLRRILITFLAILGHSDAHDSETTNFVGFNTVAEIPVSLSDMSAVPYYNMDDPRIYLFGGCISDQFCQVDSVTGVSVGCYCSQITDKCHYYLPKDDLWSSDCAVAPTPRYR